MHNLSSCQIVQKMAALPMLDTIAIRADWPLREPRPDCRRIQFCKDSPVRGSIKEARLVWAEVSLPKLLHGHNGRVLENQEQLTAALAKLRDLLNTIATPPDICMWQVWRADIAWNFNIKAAPLIFAHAALRVPGIQHGATLFSDGQGVSWSGARSRFKVMLYDKARKMHIPGSILRAEISMCGQQLPRHLAHGEIQDYAAIYRTFRAIMVRLPPIQTPTEAAGWQEALGPESLEVRQRVLARLAHKPQGTLRRYRRRMEAAAANLPGSFSWENILPAGSPPPPVNCEPTNQRRHKKHDNDRG